MPHETTKTLFLKQKLTYFAPKYLCGMWRKEDERGKKKEEKGERGRKENREGKENKENEREENR